MSQKNFPADEDLGFDEFADPAFDPLNPVGQILQQIYEKIDRWVELNEEISTEENALSAKKKERDAIPFDLPPLFTESGTEAIVRGGKKYKPEPLFGATLKGESKSDKEVSKIKLMKAVEADPSAKHLIKPSLNMGSIKTWLKELDPDGTGNIEVVKEECPEDIAENINITSVTRVTAKKA